MPVSISTSKLGKSPFIFSTGLWAKQANGSISVSSGDTVVLATACMSRGPSLNRDFFPLTVEYQERTYAMGKIPGGFFKKEGRPKDSEILTSRLIDRPLRPLFPEGLVNEVQLIAMVLSSDGINDPDILAVNAASAALYISDIPFDNPVGAVRVSRKGKDLLINPSYEERQLSDMDLVVVGTEAKIVMLEGALKEVAEEDVLAAINFAHPFIKESIALQKELRKKAGKPKKEVELFKTSPELISRVKALCGEKMEGLYGLTDRDEKYLKLQEIIFSLVEELVNEESEITESDIKSALSIIEEEILRKKILKEGLRPDKRSIDEIRSIECKVGVLPRTHGSAIFTRGQTQSLAVVTLGTSSDDQLIEALEGETTKHFMLHYSFPPFSVGEVKFMRGPSRRDVGHGALAERALIPVLPKEEGFPYTLRILSEVLESNGSSSMATVCGSSLSLMDAGVPITGPVAGIAMGLIKEGDQVRVLSDILGDEDHLGDKIGKAH